MADMNEASWIEANVEAVENYLKNEFENFGIAHQADTSHTHTFTVDNGKKLFKLFNGDAGCRGEGSGGQYQTDRKYHGAFLR